MFLKKSLYKLKRCVFFFLTCLTIATGFAQTDSLQILEINKTKQEIKDSLPTYKMVEKDTDPGGGYRHAYILNNEVVLTIIYHRDGNIDKYVEWYFSKGELIFSEQTWTNATTEKIVDNEKFYLREGRLFAWIKKDDRFVDPDSKPFKNFDSGLEAYAIKLKADAR
jgi:hypothetical protein